MEGLLVFRRTPNQDTYVSIGIEPKEQKFVAFFGHEQSPRVQNELVTAPPSQNSVGGLIEFQVLQMRIGHLVRHRITNERIVSPAAPEDAEAAAIDKYILDFRDNHVQGGNLDHEGTAGYVIGLHVVPRQVGGNLLFVFRVNKIGQGHDKSDKDQKLNQKQGLA
jgi:hypothetical protein